MAKDGSVKIGVDLDDTGLKKGLNNLQGTFTKGITGLGSVTKTAFSATTKAIAGVSTGIAGLGAASVAVGKEFEGAMSKVQATSGASAEDLEKLKQTALEMGSSTKFSATESAEALNYMAMAGWKTEQMIGGISGIMDLAAASGEDLAMVSDIVTDSLTAFRLQAEESGRFADVLAAATSDANTTVSMLGESFKYVAPVAGALGYSIEDTSVALGLMANAGIKASSSGTALRTLITNLASPTKTSAMAIEELGLNIQDAQGNMLPFNDVILQLRDSFNGLTEAEKAQYAEMLAGKEGMSGLLAIVNASQADFDKLTGAINNSSGAAAEMADIMSDNLQGRLKELSSKLENLRLKIYGGIQEPLKEVTEYVIGLVTELQKTFDEGGFEGVVNSLGTILSQVLTDIASKAPEMIMLASQFITNFLTGLNENPEGFTQAAKDIITALTNAFFENLPLIIDTGIMLFTAFIEGLITAINENKERIIEAFDEIINSLLDAIDKLLPGLKPVTNAIRTLKDNMDKLLPVVTGLTTAFVAYKTAMGISALINTVTNGIKALKTATDGMKISQIALNAVMNANPFVLVATLIAGLVTALITLWHTNEDFRNAVINAWEAVKTGISNAVDSIKTFFTETLPNAGRELLNFFKELPGKLLDIGKDLIRGLWDGIISMKDWLWEKLSGWAGGIVDNVKGFFGIHSPSRLFRDEIGKMLVEGMVVGVDALSDDLVNSLVSPYDDASSEIGKRSSQLEGQYVNINPFNVGSIDTNEIVKSQKALTQGVEKTFNNIKEILILNTTETTNFIIEFLKSQITNLQNEFLNKLLKILPTQLKYIGLMAITGFEEGLTSKMDRIKTQVSDFANSIISEMQRTLDIHSPSRKTQWLGEMLDEGLIKGIEKGEKGILSTIKNLGIVDAFKQQIPYVKNMVSSATNSMIPKSASYVSNNSSTKNITNRQGDLIINISGMELKNGMDIKTMLQEFSFYQKQRELATGGV